jgi:hypothetical protein
MSEPKSKRNRKTLVEQARPSAETLQPVLDEWQAGLARLPIDIEQLARETGALRRKRAVKSGGDLLRLALAYSVLDWPLRLVGAWATTLGLAEMSDVAVGKRLRHTQVWLSRLVGQVVGLVRLSGAPGRLRLRLIDATVITQPGSTGTDWRVHVSFDVGQLSLDEWEVTDAQGGESLLRHAVAQGEVIVADAGYAHRAGLGHVLQAGAQLVVRTNGHNLPLELAHNERLAVREWLRGLAASTKRRERRVWVTTPQGRFPLRLIAQRLPPAAAQAAARRSAKAGRKKGRHPSALSQVMAGWVVVVTNLPVETWTTGDVLALYRVRWQVELLIKRFKSVLDLDQLRTKNPELAQVYLLGKALGVLLDDWQQTAADAVRDWFDETKRPVSVWRWGVYWLEHFKARVRGTITLAMIQAAVPKLGRYLCDAPRRRPNQLARVRHWLARFGLSHPATPANFAQVHA